MAENHVGAEHLALVTREQLTAGDSVYLDIQGPTGRHSHKLSLNGDLVKMIAAGLRVEQRSTTDPHANGFGDHYHLVTFNPQ